MKLLSYKGDKKLKSALLAEIEKHKKADQIIQGTYGAVFNGDWKGCAVGCSIHSLNRLLGKDYSTSDHTIYEKELGIPEWLARLEDRIFEGLPTEEAKKWPTQFTKAVPVGVDLDPIKWKFCSFILKENIEQVLTLNITDDLKEQVVKAISNVLSVHKKAIKTGEWDESAAWSAARSAESAARSAESAAWSAARSAAWSAAWSARSARSAAWSAAWSARSAESAASAAWSAESAAAYQKYAKYLLKLLKETE